MRAVVVGGNGFIGSHLVDALLADKWLVVVYDRSPERYRPPLARVEYVLGELGNTDLVSSVLRRGDVVFHLASTTIPQSSNDAPTFDIRSNLVDTVPLLKECVKAQVSKVVLFSSGGAIYGVPESLPVGEQHPTNPICSYGIVKLALEKYLHLFRHLYGLPYVVLRPSNPYGERQRPDGDQGAIAVFLGRIAQNQPVTIWGDGSTVRDYFYVSDLADACIVAASSATDLCVFNVGSGQGIALNTLLKSIESVLQVSVDVKRLSSRRFDVPEMVLDTTRARSALNWRPQTSLEAGISRTWDWVRSLKWLNAVV